MFPVHWESHGVFGWACQPIRDCPPDHSLIRAPQSLFPSLLPFLMQTFQFWKMLLTSCRCFHILQCDITMSLLKWCIVQPWLWLIYLCTKQSVISLLYTIPVQMMELKATKLTPRDLMWICWTMIMRRNGLLMSKVTDYSHNVWENTQLFQNIFTSIVAVLAFQYFVGILWHQLFSSLISVFSVISALLAAFRVYCSSVY